MGTLLVADFCGLILAAVVAFVISLRTGAWRRRKDGGE
jgi:hypothetical protein